jgi:hypothetical protein
MPLFFLEKFIRRVLMDVSVLLVPNSMQHGTASSPCCNVLKLDLDPSTTILLLRLFL